jgi:hypothetical protein
MCPVLSSQGLNQNWQQLYKTALFETNRNKVAERIVEAERVIAARARDLFKEPADMIEEQNALDDALYALHALKGCLIWRDERAAA